MFEVPQPAESAHELEDDQLLLIVVGADLRAELSDRPVAYRLREQILRWYDEHGDEVDAPLEPTLCTDLWYLNDRSLTDRPVVAVGDPEINAASAYLANYLPTAFVVEQTLRVHLDPEFVQRSACLWGVNTSATVSAVDAFVERYLDTYLRSL